MKKGRLKNIFRQPHLLSGYKAFGLLSVKS